MATLTYANVTGEQLKLAPALLGYAVGMTDTYGPGWPITRKQTLRNKFEQLKKYMTIF